MLTQFHRYNAFVKDFPILNRMELTLTANLALGYFMRLQLGRENMHSIEEAIGHENRDNGYLILQYLLQMYGRSTDEDIAQAKESWKNTRWNDRDNIDTYTQRFHKRLSLLRDCIATRPDMDNEMPTSDQTTMKYLTLLIKHLPPTHTLRWRVQDKYTKCKDDLEKWGQLDTNVAEISYQLFQAQLTEDELVHHQHA
jgi:hypothetical protein